MAGVATDNSRPIPHPLFTIRHAGSKRFIRSLYPPKRDASSVWSSCYFCSIRAPSRQENDE